MTIAAEERIAALERRVRALEDTMAICQLIATYGPAVDSECAPAVGELWSEDGVYDPGGTGTGPYVGRAAVGDLVHGERHQGYVQAGCAHVLSAPQVTVDGETAVAVNHSRVYLRNGAHWRLERVSANRWELARVDGTWQVRRRTNRLLDGSPEARSLLRPGSR
jgi:SnoaL-like domain